MSDLYLIAHKVRGEPAFDVAERRACPICLEAYNVTGEMGCDSCDDGIWWIIPTSGHRAYPYWSHPLEEIIDASIRYCETTDGSFVSLLSEVPKMPEGHPDHYACNDRPARERNPLATALSTLLNLGRKAPPDFKRRI